MILRPSLPTLRSRVTFCRAEAKQQYITSTHVLYMYVNIPMHKNVLTCTLYTPAHMHVLTAKISANYYKAIDTCTVYNVQVEYVYIHVHVHVHYMNNHVTCRNIVHYTKEEGKQRTRESKHNLQQCQRHTKMHTQPQLHTHVHVHTCMYTHACTVYSTHRHAHTYLYLIFLFIKASVNHRDG